MYNFVGTRTARVAIAALLSVSALGAAGSAAESSGEPSDVPVARATTVVRATGHAGTRIEIPDGARLFESGIDLSVGDSPYGLVGLSQRACVTPDDLCIDHYAYAFPGRPEGDDRIVRAADSGVIEPGLYDIYVLTDGSATLTLHFENGPGGHLALDAMGRVDAHVERLEPHCVEEPERGEDCLDGVYGSAVHSIDPPGYASVAAFADRDSTGSNWAEACLDPHFGTTPTGARESQYGCPVSPTDEHWNPATTATVLLGSTPTVNGAGNHWIHTNHNPDGEVYTGYFARQQTPLGDATHGGFGFWLSGGIDYEG